MATKKWWLSLVVLFLTGCAPVVSQEVLRDV
ncbi:MAG: hypothetical protein H6R37_280, partial [Deltaproteobacteria bacterium]|nr:hypothetical protein [Deltaproteobacteria bacterium]